MKIKLIVLSVCIVLGQTYGAAFSSEHKPPMAVARSASGGESFRGDEDGASIAGSVRTAGTTRTVKAESVEALKEANKRLTANNAQLGGLLQSLLAVIDLKPGEDLLARVRRNHDTLTHLSGLLAPVAGEDLLTAAARVRKGADEKALLEARYATQVASLRAAHEVDIARLRTEYEARMAAEARSQAEALELLKAQVSTAAAALAAKEEEVRKSSARIVELEKAIRLASAAIARRELDLANQIKSAFTQQGIAEERARYYLVLATTFHGKLSSWSRPRFEEYRDTDALDLVAKTYEDEYERIVAEIDRAKKALDTASSLEIGAIVSMLAAEASNVASGRAPASTLVVEMPGSAKKIIGGSHRKLSRTSDPGFPSGRPPLVPTGGSAAMAKMLAAAPAPAPAAAGAGVGTGGKRG